MPDSAEPKTADKKALLIEVRENYKKATEADQENRRRAEDNIKFALVPGGQWDEASKKERGKDRLMLEFPKLRVQCKRVINEMRANRAQARFLGFEEGDKKLAETLSGMFRNTWNMSDGDSIADYQGEYQVYGGYGVWQLVTEYSSDSAFDQDIKIINIPNPFCVWADPSDKDMLKRKAEWWIKTDKIKRSSYEKRWPKADAVDFGDTEFDDDEEWEDDDSVRIVEYWFKKREKKTLYLLADGATVDTLPEGAQPIKERETVCYKVMSVICSGSAVLEGPTEFCCDEFPFVPVYGEYLVIDGKVVWNGMVEPIKDAQRAYNSHRTAMVESAESATRATTWITAEEAKGHTKSYAEAHKKNFPIALYNETPNGRGPQRIGGADVPVALIQGVQMAAEEINSLAGFTFDPTATDAKNISGKALNARASAGQIATFNYPDNMAKAHKRTGEIFVKMAPKIYDTRRIVRTLGNDGTESFAELNTVDPRTGQKVNDLSRGKFDVVVNTGPSHQTKRQEAAEVLIQMAANDETLMATAGDLVYKSLDIPYADDIADRKRLTLPPQIQEHVNKGKELPPEVMAAQAQIAQQAELLNQKEQLMHAAMGEAQEEVAKADKAKADLQIAAANLKTQQAQFDVHVAQAENMLTKMAMDLDVKEMGVDHRSQETERASKENESVSTAVEQTLKSLQEFRDALQAETQEFLANAAEVVVAAKTEKPKRRPVRVEAQRVNGKLVGNIAYDDGETAQMTAERGPNGQLIGTLN